MDAGNRGRVSPGLVAGILIIVLGVLLLLHQNGVIERNVWEYWPVALIVIGLLKLFESDTSGRAFGLILVIVGGVFLSRTLWPEIRFWSRLWPAAIIAVGLLLLWRAIESQRELPADSSSPSRLSGWTLFGGVERQITTREFEGGEVLAIFGGWNLDLRKADMKLPAATIIANCIFGGVEIRVPESWDVTLQGTGLFGGYSDKTQHPRPEELPGARRLFVKGTAIFGGVEVKS
jgi:predicted membrane protein